MMFDGGNSYKMPHMGKCKMSSTDHDNHFVQCDLDLYNEVSQKLPGISSIIVYGKHSSTKD